ncbi:MAG TPA: hypothetical protein PLN05_15380, partial [Pyrinomonadaceae bacterium]|nr:hypothetical protein [Pyrinomonadaceae bacterium]
VSSTVANRARRSVGGGVLIFRIKLAAFYYASTVPKLPASKRPFKELFQKAAISLFLMRLRRSVALIH